jgi:Fe-S-cluster containining protein
MEFASRIDSSDAALIQIVDAALAEGARKSGAWLVCCPGCTECCIGPFAITQLDARRLRLGLTELEARDPGRASRIRERATASVARLWDDFPGDPVRGILDEARAEHSDFGEDEPCPALDPATGTCDLYSARPITCRTFGPPVRCGSESLGVCNLCFQSATDGEIAACEVEIDPEGLEAELLEALEKTSGLRGQTIVAFALSSAAVQDSPSSDSNVG